jgi:hypothetical protein
MRDKWIPLTFYTSGYDLRIIQAKRSSRTGFIKFRTRCLAGPINSGLQEPKLDINAQWNEIIAKGKE